MYEIDDEVKALFKAHNRQVARITPIASTFASGTITPIMETMIISGGLTINRYVTSGSKIEIGSAISAELTLTLNNFDGTYDDWTFEGLPLNVEIGVVDDSGTTHYFTAGIFTVDEVPKKGEQITLTALDLMMYFANPVDADELKALGQCTILELLEWCCEKSSVTLYTSNLDSLPNIHRSIMSTPDTEDLTYTQLIQWIGEMTGTCAYINGDGKLCLKWYESTDTEITSAERYSGAELYENDITITGIALTDSEEETEYISGEDTYTIDIEDNELMKTSAQVLLDNIADVIVGFSYRPYSCNIVPMPWIEPLDIITYTDKKGNSYQTIVTYTDFKLNSSMAIKGEGKTTTTAGYASKINPFLQKMIKLNKQLENQLKTSVDDINSNLSSTVIENLTLANLQTVIDEYVTQGSDTALVDKFTDLDEEIAKTYLTADNITFDDNTHVLTVKGVEYPISAEADFSDLTISLTSGTLYLKNNDSVLGSASISEYVKNQGYVTSTQLNIYLAGLATTGDVTAAVEGLATTEYVDEQVNNVALGDLQGIYLQVESNSYVSEETNEEESSDEALSENARTILENDFGDSKWALYVSETGQLIAKGATISNSSYDGSDVVSISGTGQLTANNISAYDSDTGTSYSATELGITFNTDGGNINGTWFYQGSELASDSDRNLKNTITDLADEYETLFDNLRPVSYKYNNGTSGRLHTGFIAQEVEEAIAAAGLTNADFGAFVRRKNNGLCALRYSEFIALCVAKIQKLEKRVEKLETKIKELET